MPGQPNTDSTMKEPVTRLEKRMPARVITGSRQFFSTWLKRIPRWDTPLALAVSTYSSSNWEMVAERM